MPRKSKRLQDKKDKKADRRASVGEALGVDAVTSDGTNLSEERALETVLAAARHLNQVAVSGGKPRVLEKREQQSSASLMKATRKLFASDSEDELSEFKAENSPAEGEEKTEYSSASEGPPGLVSVSNSSSTSYSNADASDTEGDNGPPGLNKPKVPENRAEPSPVSQVAPEKPVSREEEITPQPVSRPDSEAPSMPSPGFATDGLKTPRLNEVISLVTTSEYDKEVAAGAEGTPQKDNSIIETPDRAPEVHSTEDKAFIKGSDESSSIGGISTSDGEYEPTDASPGDSISGLSFDDEPPPPAPPRDSPDEGAPSQSDLEVVRRELEDVKAQRAREAQERVDKEVERRAAEMCEQRLAAAKEELRKKAEAATARAIAELTVRSKPATLDDVTKKRREKIASAVAKAVETPLPAASPPSRKEKKAAKKARKRAAQKKAAAAARERAAADEAAFNRQLEEAR